MLRASEIESAKISMGNDMKRISLLELEFPQGIRIFDTPSHVYLQTEHLMWTINASVWFGSCDVMPSFMNPPPPCMATEISAQV